MAKSTVTTGSGTATTGDLKIKSGFSQPMLKPDEPDEFARFEALTGKLAQVPKSEMDKKRQTS